MFTVTHYDAATFTMSYQFKYPHANGLTVDMKEVGTDLDSVNRLFVGNAFEYLQHCVNDFVQQMHKIRRHWFDKNARPHISTGYKWRADFIRLQPLHEHLMKLARQRMEYNYCQVLQSELPWMATMIPDLRGMGKAACQEMVADMKKLTKQIMEKVVEIHAEAERRAEAAQNNIA